MKRDRPDLLEFLMRDADWMSPDEVSQFQESVAAHPETRSRWLKFREIAESVAIPFDPNSVLPEPGQARVDSQILSAYLEGSLDPARTARLERLAWERPNLIRELILHFRGHFIKTRGLAIPQSLTSRLLELTREWGSEIEIPSDPEFRQPNGSPTLQPPVATPLKVPLAEVFPAEFPMALPMEPRAARRRRLSGRRWRQLTHLIAALAIVGLIGGLLWTYRMSLPKRLPTAVQDRPVQSPMDELPLAHSDPSAGESEPSPPSDLPKFAINDADHEPSETEISPIESNPAAPRKIVEMDVAADETPDLPIEPAASPNRDDALATIPGLEWEQIEGLLALRFDDRPNWLGPKAVAQIRNGAQWQTLPQSWAAVRLESFGTLVMAADTAARLEVIASERKLHVDLLHGAVALRRLPANTQVHVRNGKADWLLRIESDDTTLGLDWHDDAPRVFVRKGNVTLSNYELRANQQAILGDDGRLAVGTVRGKSAWVERPTKKSEIPPATQENLLASNNLLQDLDRLTAQERTGIIFAQYLPAVLNPEQKLLTGLEDPNSANRQKTLQWLMSLPPNHPRTRMIWRTLSAKSGAPEYARAFFRMVQLAKISAPISQDDAQLLINGLRHERMFVRQISQGFLETGFGNSLHYEADAPAPLRQRTADAWGREILQHYRRQ